MSNDSQAPPTAAAPHGSSPPGVPLAVPFQELLGRLQHPVLILSDTSRIAWLNAAAKATFRLQVGDDWLRTLRCRGDLVITCPDPELATDRSVKIWRIGSRLYNVDAASLSSPDGSLFLILVLNDITGQHQEELRLREANRDLREFAQSLGHELRLPLTPVMSYAQYLAEDCGQSLSYEVREAVTGILSQTRRMLSLLESLQQMGCTGYVERPTQPVDIAPLIVRVREDLRPLFGQRTEAMRLLPAPRVRVPESLLYAVLGNLLRNALQHGGDTDIIEIGGESRKEHCYFFVRDYGRGIPTADYGSIFQPHQRGSSAVGNGSGIGLAVVSRITSLYGGHSWAEETEGGGATFWFSFANPPTDS